VTELEAALGTLHLCVVLIIPIPGPPQPGPVWSMIEKVM
jgi:hypothetical protein